MPDEKKGLPIEEEVSDRVKGRYGYKDSRIEVDFKLPPPFSIMHKNWTLKLTIEEARKLKKALDPAVAWGDLPDYQRHRDGAD